MAAKYRNIRNLIAIWLIVSIVISTVAKTETLIEKEISLSQTRSLPGQGVLASLDNIESPYQILQRARIGQKTGEQPEPKYKTEPNAELEYRDEPSPNNEYRPVSDSDFVAVAKLKTVRIQSMLTLPMSYLVIPRIDTTPVEPLEILKIPDDAPKEPAFFVIKAGDRNVTGLTYRSMKNMNQVKLVLDTDGDGIFSDEKEYLGARDPMIITFMTYNFGNVTTQNIKEGISGGIFNVQCTNGEWLTLHPVLYREGKVVLDGTSYRIGVVDGNFDGKYNGIFSTPVSGRLPKCDIFAIDLNGNQEYDYHPSVESEVMPLSRFIKVKDQYYSIQVVKDGGSIEFRKADIQFGTLDLGGEDVALYFWSDSMHYQIEGSRKTWQLPVGKYGVSSMKLSEKNSEGEKFDFVAPSSTTGQLASFEIKADQTTRIPLGKPKKIVTSMERVGEEIKLSFSLVGKAGELYIPGAEKDGEMIPEPKFKVIDESGKVVHSGKFEYG